MNSSDETRKRVCSWEMRQAAVGGSCLSTVRGVVVAVWRELGFLSRGGTFLLASYSSLFLNIAFVFYLRSSAFEAAVKGVHVCRAEVLAA